MSNLIEAGDGLVDALASGNTGTVEKAVEAWDAAKADYVEENGIEDDVVDVGDAPSVDAAEAGTAAEPGADPDDGGEGGEAADAPSSPLYV